MRGHGGQTATSNLDKAVLLHDPQASGLFEAVLKEHSLKITSKQVEVSGTVL